MRLNDYDKVYQELKTHLRYLNEKMIEAFSLFVKLATAIIGGTFWLHMKLPAGDPQRYLMARGTSMLLLLTSVGLTLVVINNLRAWHSYRHALSTQFPDIPSRTKWWSWVSEVILCVIMLAVALGFFGFNPL